MTPHHQRPGSSPALLGIFAAAVSAPHTAAAQFARRPASVSKREWTMKLLIVEDDPLIGPAMRAVLRSAGHVVHGPVRDGAKAMRLADVERPDLALVDYHLAGREDGLCVVRRLSSELGVPSLLVTGFDHRADDVRDMALGFLHKPFSPEALIGAVKAAESLLAGNAPMGVPGALELFRTGV